MAALRRGTLSVGGLQYDTLAAGPETGTLALLLHGFPQFADSWTGVAEELGAAGFHAVAVNQRGYSAGARPQKVADYDLAHLTADVLAFADALGASRFHLVGHDWGAVLAWRVAGLYPERICSLTALAVPHTDAFFQAVRKDPQQMWKSKYIAFFRLPGHIAERCFLANGASLLRRVYGGVVPASQVEANVRRLREPGALTAALNWYRALALRPPAAGRIQVPTLYVWGDQDVALGETAALATEHYVTGPYRFERVRGGSHWLLEERPAQMESLIVEHVTGHP